MYVKGVLSDILAMSSSSRLFNFSASVQTCSMTKEEADALISELSKVIVDFCSCTRNNEVEYEGKVKINSYCKNPLVETPTTRFFTVSFDATAIDLYNVNMLQHFNNVNITYSVEYKYSK